MYTPHSQFLIQVTWICIKSFLHMYLTLNTSTCRAALPLLSMVWNVLCSYMQMYSFKEIECFGKLANTFHISRSTEMVCCKCVNVCHYSGFFLTITFDIFLVTNNGHWDETGIITYYHSSTHKCETYTTKHLRLQLHKCLSPVSLLKKIMLLLILVYGTSVLLIMSVTLKGHF